MRFAILLGCCAALLAASVARADVIVLKSGVRIETEKVFSMAGAYYYKRDGAMTSVAESEVEKIEKGSPAEAATPAEPQPQAEPAAEELSPEEAELQFIKECRLAIDAEARKTNSDYKATCGKALRMVERMYEGTDPTDGTFGYYLDALNNPIMWEILPKDQSTKLKAVVFQKDGIFDGYFQPYKERLKAAKFDVSFALAEAAQAREAEVNRKEAEYNKTHNSRTRWAEQVQRRQSSASYSRAGSRGGGSRSSSVSRSSRSGGGGGGGAKPKATVKRASPRPRRAST